MTAAALAVLDDLSGLGPDVDELLSALIRAEQGAPLPLFAADARGPSPWRQLHGQPMTQALADVLQRVEDLSDGQGFQLLQLQMREVGVQPRDGLSRQGLALWAATHHRAAFDEAYRLRREVRRCRMRTLRGRETRASVLDNPLGRERLRRRLADAGRDRLDGVEAGQEPAEEAAPFTAEDLGRVVATVGAVVRPVLPLA